MTVGGLADTVFCFSRPCACHLYTAPRNKLVSGLRAALVENQLDQALIDAIKTIDSNGDTNIRAGIEAACQELSDHGQAARRGAILLTDGEHNQGPFETPQKCFADRGWPIYAFGFAEASQALLDTVAKDTGGASRFLRDVTSLVCEFQGVRARIAGAVPKPCLPLDLGPGETKTTSATLQARQAQATFSASWIGSDIVMTLTTPSGRVIDRGTDAPDVIHLKGPTFEVYTITNPEPGEWKVDLFAADVPPGGEKVVFGFTTIPLADERPTPTAIFMPGNQPWTDTGLDLAVGSSVSITASGTIKIAPEDPGKTPAGDSSCIGPTGRKIDPTSETWLTPGLTCWSLVGRIGEDGVPFEIGTSLSFPVETAGRLYLGVNDEIGRFGNNSGSWMVDITVGDAAAETALAANAGPDQTVPGPSPVTVQFDGSGSTGDIVRYQWYNQYGLLRAEGATPVIDVNFGYKDPQPGTQRTFTLVVEDAQGNTAQDQVTITLGETADTEPPTISWVKPVGTGETYSTASGTIELEVAASDSSGIRLVEFLRWGGPIQQEVEIGTDSSSPYQASLEVNTLNIGENGILAVAVDTAGNRGIESISIYRLNPTITLDPTEGPPETEVTATGSGWLAGHQVSVQWEDGTELATTTVDDNGGFTASFSVPDAAAEGEYTVDFVGIPPEGEAYSIPATFTVTTPASPSSGPAGSRLAYRCNHGRSCAMHSQVVQEETRIPTIQYQMYITRIPKRSLDLADKEHEYNNLKPGQEPILMSKMQEALTGGFQKAEQAKVQLLQLSKLSELINTLVSAVGGRVNLPAELLMGSLNR
jgi:hypothetical protein